MTQVHWESTENSTPSGDRTVMVNCFENETPFVWIGYWDIRDETWRFVDGNECEPTHWAELPPTPHQVPA